MLRKTLVVVSVAAVLMLFDCMSHDYVVTHPSTTGMAGLWQGKVRPMIPEWYPNDLDIAIRILPDGKVSGKAGDAEIENGKLLIPSGISSPDFNYQIQADLKGPLIADKGIERRTCVLFIRFDADELVGQFRAIGATFGGSKKMSWDFDLVDVTKTAP